MNKIILFVGLSLLFACSTQKKVKDYQQKRAVSQATAPPKKDVSTTPAIVAMRSQYLLVDSLTARIFIELETQNFSYKGDIADNFNSHFTINWLMVPDFGIKDRLGSGKVDVSKNNCQVKDDKIQIYFDIPRAKNQNKGLLLTEITEQNSGKKATNDLTLTFVDSRLNERFGLFTTDKNVPLFRKYVNNAETFEIKSLNNTAKSFFVVYYQYAFEPAASPMSTSNRSNAPRTLAIDTVLKVSTNTPIKFKTEGLYYVTEDTSSTKNGFGFLVVDDRYPRLTYPTELAQPLLYMSTREETQSLRSNTNPKQALDLYFLSLANGNQNVAKHIIKAYYHRVEDANRLFTTYKEGWKTDKGMIYIILGPPNRIQRSKEREVWVYSQSQNFSEIIFTFYKKPNQFTDNHYELLRYPEYNAYWYPFVEAWRTGNVSE